MRRLVQSSIRRIDDRCEPHEQSAQAPGDTAFHYDCPLEGGEFELAVPMLELPGRQLSVMVLEHWDD